MDEPVDSALGTERELGNTAMTPDLQPLTSGRAMDNGLLSRRLEWIAGVFFFANLFLMLYSGGLYYRDEAWGSTMVAISTATSVILLLSVVFSIFGKPDLSRIAIGVGIVGIAISVVSLGVKLMQQISEW